MQAVLLLKLQSPMQSWGTQSRFNVRDTGLEPSKSGVIGLICAALGRGRDADISDIISLKMGVRVEKEGRMLADYHTAKNIMKASGGSDLKDTEVSTRYYLSDSDFLVGLEGDTDLLKKIHKALRNPVWSLYLGRKAFVPATPVWISDGYIEGTKLEDVLRDYPYIMREGDPKSEKECVRLRIVLEDPDGPEVRNDVPLSFRSDNRLYSLRRVRTEWIKVEVQQCISQD